MTQCAIDMTNHLINIVQSTVGFQHPEQLAALADFVKLTCTGVSDAEVKALMRAYLNHALSY